MFLDHISNKSRLWKFLLINGKTLIGSVEDFRMDTQGHPIMLSVWTSASIHFVNVPWTAIVYIESFRNGE